MCGICGILEYERAVDPGVLAAMNGTLRHRGPDDEQYHLERVGERGVGVGLGFRRLSIIDLEGGRQPMSNEDDTVWVIFNGEIYNFEELRPGLEGRGHVFRTHADTEVIVHLYEEMGPACVERLNGMFALAVWDVKRQSLFLARDRMGKKPLYWADTGRSFLFGSELKALLRHPDCPRQLNAVAMEKYLAFEYVPSPDSILSGIQKLPAGHSLEWRQGRVEVKRYWDLSFADPAAPADEEAVAAEFRDRLRECVRRRLVSDVPLGVFLSGGIDSSTVVALMSELVPPADIQTFSIAFEDPSFDESTHARTVAEHFGTSHHEQVLEPRLMLDILPRVAAFLDEPFADASVIPTYLLSRFTREHVTVALGGDGGDELLAGYPTFQAHRAARYYRVPAWLHERVVLPLADRLPVSTDNFSFDFKVKRFLLGMSYGRGVRDQVWLGAFHPHELRGLLNGFAGGGSPFDPIEEVLSHCTSRDELERLIYFYCKFYLQDDILFKVDRASMACSLEVRAPFLDHTFVEFLGTIPPRLKLRGLTTKYILKRAMGDRLPPGIAHRAKKGFGMPVAKWLQGDLRQLAGDLLSPSRLRSQGIFHGDFVGRLWDEHQRGERDHRKQLWTLLMFQLWHEHYLQPAGDATLV